MFEAKRRCAGQSRRPVSSRQVETTWEIRNASRARQGLGCCPLLWHAPWPRSFRARRTHMQQRLPQPRRPQRGSLRQRIRQTPSKTPKKVPAKAPHPVAHLLVLPLPATAATPAELPVATDPLPVATTHRHRTNRAQRDSRTRPAVQAALRLGRHPARPAPLPALHPARWARPLRLPQAQGRRSQRLTRRPKKRR